MKALLICPSERSNVKLLGERMPLAAIPLLGQSLIEYWLAYLAASGVQQVTILAHDRPEYAEALVGNGARWGLVARVIRESRELTPAQALLKYDADLNPMAQQNGIAVLDRFPDQAPLFGSYADFIAGLMAWMPHALTPDRVGLREWRPGVWIGRHAHISPNASVTPPCWVGKNAIVGTGATIGPNTVIEDGSFIEPGAEVRQSFVGPDTFVGRYTEISESLAWANTLVNCRTNSTTVVPDAFVLCALREPRPIDSGGLLAKFAESYSRNKEELHLFWKHFLTNREG